MSYLQNKNNKKRKIKYIFIIVLILIPLFYFKGPIWSGVSFAGNVISRPVLKIFSNIGENFEYFSLHFKSKKDLYLEKEKLKREVIEMNIKMAEYEYLLKENKSLKEILNRLPSDKEFIIASILMQPKILLFDNLIIDIGERESVKKEKLVFGYGNVPIGKINKIYPKSSEVTLFSENKVITRVYVSSENISLELIGRGEGNFEIILPKDLILKKGDLALLPGLEDYPIAKVETIVNDPRDPYSKALLSSLVNIQELKFVEVEK